MVRPAGIQFKTPLQEKVAAFVETPKVIGFITALIILNAITLGMETSEYLVSKFGVYLHILDSIVLIVFSLEIAAKLFAYRFSFFKSGWNVFDAIIVTISWVPASGPLSVLRALRILRVLRLLSVVPQLRKVINALGHSIPGMSSVFGVLCLIFYVSAVLTTKVFGANPEPVMQELFGSLSASTYTLFQLMTLEGWASDVVNPTMEFHPWSWMFFIPFIIVTSFAVLNLFIGIIVDAMNYVQNEEDAKGKPVQLEDVHKEVENLKKEIKALTKQLKEK